MPDWIGTVGGLVGFVVFLGAAVVYLRGSRDKGTIATLESSNDALLQWQTVATAKIADLEAKAAATDLLHEAKVKALEVRLTALEAENETLKKQRPSAEAIADVMAMQQVLHEQITAHDTAAKAFFAKTEGASP